MSQSKSKLSIRGVVFQFEGDAEAGAAMLRSIIGAFSVLALAATPELPPEDEPAAMPSPKARRVRKAKPKEGER